MFDDEKWNIVLRYAPRVQGLILSHDELSLKVLQSLWFHTTLLLPNLKTLDWIYDGYTEITLIRLLLSPSLVDLHVWLDDGNNSSVMGLLERYHILCPNLKLLSFDYSGRCPHVTTAVCRAVSRSPNLKILLCGSIDETAWKHSAGFRHLRRLRTSLQDHQPADLKSLTAYCGNPGHPPFENLVTLELHPQHLSSIIPYLKSHSQPFDCVSFELDIAPTPEVLREFFTALRSTTRQRTLRKICLSMEEEEGSMPLQAIDCQTLNPLVGFNLRAFSVYLLSPVTLTDGELVQLVQAWPHLETFVLNKCWWGYHSTSNIPMLKGLLSVIE